MKTTRKLAAAFTFTLAGATCSSALAEVFPALNTQLLSHIPLSGFTGSPGNGNDCWGYVSPSGREYALMGLSSSLAVVEITNPTTPNIIAQIPHTDSLWADVKVYQNYCYVSNESGGGIDVINLSQVDFGIVTLVTHVTTNGISTTHNVAINPASGYLYLCGSNLGSGRLLALSLSNPANPTYAGQVSSTQGTYSHDAEIVTYTSGPYAGKEIAFSANGGTGLDIYDVTNKSNMIRLSRSTYPNLSYCHQCWLSEDRHYIYVNDETDGVNETVIFDVTDLSNPQLIGSYNAGTSATDHNVYVKDQFIYEADYRGGARIYCAADPLHPVQVGYFDTYPGDDSGGYNGAWSLYPYFPSGNLIISDIESGLFVVDVSSALNVGSLAFDYPNKRPELVNPNGGTMLSVDVIGACGGKVQPGTAKFNYSIAGGNYIVLPMTQTGPDSYEIAFPSANCAEEIHYFISAQTASGATVLDPAGAPTTTYHAVAATNATNIFSDNCETDPGWTTTVQGATSGFWERGVPVNDPNWEYDPSTDGDGSGQCWLTQNELGNTDVDNGAVQLISPPLDLTSGNLTIAYSYYLRLTVTDGVDRLLVEISSNGNAGPWTPIAAYTTSSAQGGVDHEEGIWTHAHISDQELVTLGVTLTNNMRLRFTANDSGTQSIVEAGVDAIEVHKYSCEPTCGVADVNCDGSVNVADLLAVINGWGACPMPPSPCPSDVAPTGGDGQVNVSDLLAVINNWG